MQKGLGGRVMRKKWKGKLKTGRGGHFALVGIHGKSKRRKKHEYERLMQDRGRWGGDLTCKYEHIVHGAEVGADARRRNKQVNKVVETEPLF